jgi:CDP-glucose 4,6-dehydratase
MQPKADFWRGKRVLLTGHTGFKGAWLALWLRQLGAEVTGLALPPDTAPHLFGLAQVDDAVRSHVCDIRDAPALAAHVRESRPEIVLHLAAQALVRASYRTPLDTFVTNTMGTAHLLEALRGLRSVRAVVVVTTDKVYANRESHHAYGEGDALGGHDPYSASKAAAEIVVHSYRAAFLAEQGVAVATARAGNVIGGGDWAQDRLIPDAVRAWRAGRALEIRRPDAVRPWQHVLEPLAGYLRLAEQIWEKSTLAGAYNFGPDAAAAASVREVVRLAQSAFGQGEVQFVDGPTGPHEAGLLMLDNARARDVLGVRPVWDLATSVTQTMRWYRQLAEGGDARALCLADLAHYQAAANAAGAP